MSIAISLKIKDGVILASDSAASMRIASSDDAPGGITHVYYNANKIINIYKGLPLGVVTWGAAGIGKYSNELILKNLRNRLTFGSDLQESKNDFKNWKLEKKDYSVKKVAELLRKYVYEELYQEYKEKTDVGFLIAGYAPNSMNAEEYLVEIKSGKCDEPVLLRKEDDVGITWRGEGEALRRLLLGISSKTEHVLKETGKLDENTMAKVVDQLKPGIEDSLITPAMPLQDGIDLAEFLVKTTIMYSRYTAGAPTVGEPVEIAAITRHEGFKWIKRKHYYSQELNPDNNIGGLP